MVSYREKAVGASLEEMMCEGRLEASGRTAFVPIRPRNIEECEAKASNSGGTAK